ncbi:hypothetical protein [Brevibacterium litoralis]|uniref:hypothetical protein n=1 Tax=Brevibacterium litoralis TaxID=3138935 RepID=UPI0032ED4B46
MREIQVVVEWSGRGGWVMRRMARPYVLVNGEGREVDWGQPAPFVVGEDSVTIGACIRVGRSEDLLGYEGHQVDPTELDGPFVLRGAPLKPEDEGFRPKS